MQQKKLDKPKYFGIIKGMGVKYETLATNIISKGGGKYAKRFKIFKIKILETKTRA